EYLVDLAPPRATELLARHVRNRVAPDRADQVADLLGEPRVAQVLDDIVAERFDGSRIVSFARQLVRVAHGEIALEDACTAAVELSTKDVRTWFEELPGARHKAFVLALAVLNGSP